MRVEIWSDVVCPWCYIGKRNFESAVAELPGRPDVGVMWRSFELDPTAPTEREGDRAMHLARKYGLSYDQAVAAQDRLTRVAAAAGLDYHLEAARPGNTLDAHRLLHLAAERGVQDAVKERFLAGYLVEGEPIGDRDTLVRLAAEAGLDPAEARAALAGDAYVDAVRADEATAESLGITGVPFFVIDGCYAISGAQPPDVIVRALEKASELSHPVVVAGEGGACASDECAV